MKGITVTEQLITGIGTIPEGYRPVADVEILVYGHVSGKSADELKFTFNSNALDRAGRIDVYRYSGNSAGTTIVLLQSITWIVG